MLLGLFLGTQPGTLVGGALILIANTYILVTESFQRDAKPKARSLSLILVLGFVTLKPGLLYTETHGLWFSGLLEAKVLALAIGVLLCLKESNFLIRWFFAHNKLIEKITDPEPKTMNGRLIGNLERLLLLFFLWQGAALAATFIVAVKGLARFKKMEEEQAFAEYVIIGTFLSVLITLVIFQLTLIWLGAPLSLNL